MKVQYLHLEEKMARPDKETANLTMTMETSMTMILWAMNIDV
jgi:hypothetical protein